VSGGGRWDRVARVIGGVLRQAVADAGATGIIVLDADTPEGELVLEWAAQAIGRERVHAARDIPAGWAAGASSDVAETELRRTAARVLATRHEWLLAHPATKTVLLLAREMPPEPLLPLGDLYASQVRELAGRCTLPDDVAAIADAAGGLDALDRALRGWLEERRSLNDVLAALPDPVQRAVRGRLQRNRAWRRWPRRVPKLTSRTLWIDVFA
jgi:hypothetical protein